MAKGAGSGGAGLSGRHTGLVKLAQIDRNSIDIGARGRTDAANLIEVPEESLMLTGDENIADVKFRVIWQIDPARPEDFAFNIKNQGETIKAVAESAMREIVGTTKIQPLLTTERKVIEPAAQAAIQNILDSYHAGVSILQVQLLSVDPPPTVIAAFRDVTAAQQDRSRFVNEAQAHANSIVPQARGERRPHHPATPKPIAPRRWRKRAARPRAI